jgi:hypothetical protein
VVQANAYRLRSRFGSCSSPHPPKPYPPLPETSQPHKIQTPHTRHMARVVIRTAAAFRAAGIQALNASARGLRKGSMQGDQHTTTYPHTSHVGLFPGPGPGISPPQPGQCGSKHQAHVSNAASSSSISTWACIPGRAKVWGTPDASLMPHWGLSGVPGHM